MPKEHTHLRVIPLLILVTVLWTTAGCEKKPDPSLNFLDAAARGDLVEVKNLLDEGVNINAKDENGITALMLASTSGYGDVVELLLAQGADSKAKNNYGETALEVTSDKKIKALLREHGQLTQIVSPTALCQAARMGDIIAVKNYLDKRGDINSKGKEGLTALIEGSLSGEKDMVELLITKGANINAKTDYGLTALIAASREGHRDIVQLLLTKGADVTIKNQHGDNALSVASKMGHEEIVELLRQYDTATQ